MFNKRYYDNSDNSTTIRFPETIKIHEHRAPTDESIKLMEECHEKAMQNIIAKVHVKDNIVDGECFAFEQQYSMHGDVKIYYKFKINGEEFTLEESVDRDIFYEEGAMVKIAKMSEILESRAKAVMLYWTLRKFTEIAYEKICGSPFPSHAKRRTIDTPY